MNEFIIVEGYQVNTAPSVARVSLSVDTDNRSRGGAWEGDGNHPGGEDIGRGECVMLLRTEHLSGTDLRINAQKTTDSNIRVSWTRVVVTGRYPSADKHESGS